MVDGESGRKTLEEFKKLEQAGVWGFGESLSASEQWSDEEWFTEIEKLASGSGVKRIPVENFLMTLDGQTRVQAEMNFENDASVYGWDGETQEAISKGISKYFSKELCHLVKKLTNMDLFRISKLIHRIQ